MSCEPGNPATWLAMHRTLEEAAILAEIWQRFPDLPIGSPPDARMARIRARCAALKPFHDDKARREAIAREIANFSFIERQIDEGHATAYHLAILEGRETHRLGWIHAVRFAEGYCAAKDARAYAPFCADTERDSYTAGFASGGGDPTDIFDRARRALEHSEIASPASDRRHPRSLPSSWPQPSDHPRPALWARRLVILGTGEASIATGSQSKSAVLSAIAGHAGAAATTIVMLNHGTLVQLGPHPEGLCLVYSPTPAPSALRSCEFDDILIAAEDADLAWLDANVHLLPHAKTCERLKHSPLLKRKQLGKWMMRGIDPCETRAGGHIRWAKAAKGISGRLGGFTASYLGTVGRAHRIQVTDDATGSPALWHYRPDGSPLDPEFTVSAKRAIKPAIEQALRRFASAITLAAGLPPENPS